MNLVDRYIYAVTSRLSEKQKSDIEKELRTLIDDMLEQYPGDEAYESKVQKVLLELGDPAILADSYRETKRYLIGPQNFDNYVFLLKIVLGAILLGISIASVTGGFFSSELDITNIIIDYIATLFSALLQGFAWVTAIFAISEYNGVDLKIDRDKDEEWKLSDLPMIPVKEASISRVESVISIVFTTIFTSIFYFAPQLIAAYFRNAETGLTLVPVFNISVLGSYKFFVLGIFILGIMKEVPKIISGRWSLKLGILVAVLSVASTILALIMFSNPEIWNMNFASDLLRYTNIDFTDADSWINITTGSILIIVIAGISEIATALYKGFKYNVK